MSLRWFWLGAGSGLLLSGCGVGPEGSTAVERGAIAGGELDSTHDAVFQEYTNWAAEERISMCTATLIAPNLLLTAQHCVAFGDRGNIVCGEAAFGGLVPADSTIVTNDAIPGSNSLFFRGADLRVPSEGNDTCGFDIAVIILDRPVPASVATPAIPRIDRHVEQGEEYAAVGYGEDEFGEPTPGRMEREGLSVRCAVGNCETPATVAPTEFVGEEGVCSGDSGGPALDADGKVVGVVSRGNDPCQRPIYGSVASWAAFLTDAALDAARVGGYDPPFWALTGSSDPPVGILPEGAACTTGDACQDGLACYYETEPSDARCTAICENGAGCSDDLICTTGMFEDDRGLCLDRPLGAPPPPGGGADESCSIARPRARSSFGLLLAIVALGGFLRRARRP